MTDPLSPKALSEAGSVPTANEDVTVQSEKDLVVSALQTLLSGEMVTDEADRKILNDAVLFLQNPQPDQLQKHQEDVGMVITGYDMAGAAVPQEITNIYNHLMTFVPPVAEIAEAQDQLLPTEHYVQKVKDLDRAIGSKPTPINVEELRQQKGAAMKLLVQAYCRDIETEFARDSLDIAVCIKAIRSAFVYAKVSARIDQSGQCWEEFRAWQASVAQRFEGAVKQIIQACKDNIDAELAKEEPEHKMIKEWWTLATSFAPELEDAMAAKYHQGVLTFCTSFMNKAAAELEKPAPDFVQIDRWMITFKNYTEHLQGTKLLEDIQALQSRVDAAKAERQGS